jgi:tRNA modification GTPase
MQKMMSFQDTIVALATPPGIGAIGVVRVSGKDAITIVKKSFKGKDLSKVPSHSLAFGTLRSEEEIIDEVLVSVFHGPNSYTKEDVIEISTHGSPFILQKVIERMVDSGARLAKPGEFTQRAFINGRFDLAQAEAVADLIASENSAMQQTAMKQMRGGFSNEIKALRERLVHFASMIELELDFAEEDVEFANREALEKLIVEIQTTLSPLIESFKWGNVIKNGVPIVIAGRPNAGKSTLLNSLLNEQRAIVSEIEGTTRDTIEDQITIEGITFRFIDTAGLRETTDTIEAIGVQRTQDKMKEASLILYLIDLARTKSEDVNQELAPILATNVPFLVIGNKQDLLSKEQLADWQSKHTIIPLSAANQLGVDMLKKELVNKVRENKVSGGQTIVTNSRHYQGLLRTNQALEKVKSSIADQVTGDFLALDIREALHHLGEITGEITTDDLLDNIFSKFCIGK